MLLHTIRVKRLDLSSPLRVCSATANFDKLAWFNREAGQVFNAGNPFIAQTVNSQPFEKNRVLNPGVHLHFILPQAITRFSEKPEDVYTAPNRWLVRKTRDLKAAGTWIIESDFLSSGPQFPNRDQSTTLLLPKENKQDQPFRYMGKVLLLEEYLARKSKPKQSYWNELATTPFTAFAHGDVHFSAFYPNCSSVFGFYDPDGQASDSYEITGWYDVNTNDNQPAYLVKISDALNSKPAEAESQVQWISNLEAQWGIHLTEDFLSSLTTNKITPSEILFYGKADRQDEATTIEPDSLVPVLGNGSEEAFSTFLAHQATGSEEDKIHLERELEALHFNFLKEQTLDLAPDFDSGRHRKGFAYETGTFLFDIVLLKKDYAEYKKQESTATIDYPIHLPEFIRLREEIELLNKLIRQQEKNELEVESRQRLLFSHWQKYLQSAHPPLMMGELLPDSNEILDFIATKVVPGLEGKMQQYGRIESVSHTVPPVGGDSATEVTIMLHTAQMGPASQDKPYWQYSAKAFEALNNSSALNTHAAEIIKKLTIIKGLIESLNAHKDLVKDAMQLVLQHRQGLTYYRPIQPTLMLAGESLKDLMPVKGFSNPTIPLSNHDSFTGINNFLTQIAAGQIPANTPLFNQESKITEQSVPLFLDWEAYFFPVEKIESRHEEYYKNFIADCFEIRREDAEFSLKTEQITFSEGISRYAGRTIPTTTAGKNIEDKINNLPENLKTAIPGKVLETLNSNGFLIQALDGLNAAFLQEKSLMQLPIEDPIAFSAFNEIFERLNLSRLIGDHRFHTPEPEFDFSPIRSGGIHLSAIELINTFGVVTHIAPQQESLLVPETMRPIDRKSLKNQSPYISNINAFFYPRFMQETALATYWLNAEHNTPIYTQATNANPICGWIVPNFMTKALAVYTTDGDHLCNILQTNKVIRFEPGPNADSFEIDQVKNKHLKKVLEYTATLPDLNSFLAFVQDSLLFIDPENAPNHNDLNYMFGRPLALVRMQVNFETKGTYASRKDHYAFRDMLKTGNAEPITAKYESVNIPLQIGDYTKLNEGVVLYWKDLDKNQSLYSSSVSPEENSVNDEKLPEVKPKVNHALKNSPVNLTLLIDPRAEAHISSGVVPLTIMKLDERFWKPVLQKLRVDFDMGPGLFPKGEIRLNLPNSSDYGWAWLQKHLDEAKNPFFTLTPQLPSIRKVTFENEKLQFETLKQITWEQLEKLEVLEPPYGGDLSYSFVKYENCQPGKTHLSEDIITDLLELFDKYCTRISPVETSAEFRANEFHDGWLELYDASAQIQTGKYNNDNTD